MGVDGARGAEREAQPRRRGTFATLLRFEHRDLSHSESPSTSSWRFRSRFELAYPVNRSKLTQDGAIYLADPLLYWRIADANAVIDPFELTDVLGRRVDIPLPPGMAGP